MDKLGTSYFFATLLLVATISILIGKKVMQYGIRNYTKLDLIIRFLVFIGMLLLNIQSLMILLSYLDLLIDTLIIQWMYPFLYQICIPICIALFFICYFLLFNIKRFCLFS